MSAPSDIQMQTTANKSAAPMPTDYDMSPCSDTTIDVADCGATTFMTVQPSSPYKQHHHNMTQHVARPEPNAYLQSQLRSGFAVAQFPFNDPSSLTAFFITTAVAKAHSAMWKRFWSGWLAGFFVVFGTVFALVAAGGLDPAFRAAYPAVPKLITGATFPVCLLMIMLVGGDLFTGDCMYAMMGFATGRIGFGSTLNLLLVSFFSNLTGILFFVYFLGYQTDLLVAEPYHSYVVYAGTAKVSMSWGVVVLRGVGANAMVCTAIFMGSTARDALGRFVIAWWPVAVFAVIGFEHVVANMAFIPLSMLYGADFSVSTYITKSMIPSCIGNIIGGSFIIGGFTSYLYSKPRQSSFKEWLKFAFVPDVSISEWFEELYLQLWNDRPIRDEVKAC